MPSLKTALLTAVLIGAGGAAFAQMGATYDPSQLPTIKGKVAQFLPTPRGDVDGFLLDDGTEVHVPPHLSAQLVFAVRPGDAVTIHGLKARAVTMVAASSVTNDASNVTVTDNGPPHRHENADLTAEGKIKAVLHDPRGEAHGALLEDGTAVYLPPPEARRLADQLAVGKTIMVKGDGTATLLGRAVVARQIGADAAHLVAVAGPHAGWGPWGHEHGHGGMFGRWMHGPHGDDAPPPSPPPAQ